VRISRPVRVGVQLLVSGAIIAFLLWQIDVGRTVDLIRSSNGWEVLAAYGIFVVTTVGMAWRWKALLASKGIKEPLGWLTKLYFMGYAAGQVLPTSLGGDALRITAHARRRPHAKGEAAAAVLMERAVGSAGTLVLVALGLIVAIGRYDNIAVLVWLEAVFAVTAAAVFVVLFSRRANAWLQSRESTRRLARAFQSVWLALHAYRQRPGVLGAVLGATLLLQMARIISIWLCGEAVGVGPLLFLIMLIPFTINGLGVREAFFIAFLGRFDVSANAAFATGFLFYAISIGAAIPGGFIMLWESLRRPPPAQPVDPSAARVP
jgi:uncharacterized protein (TIRG00374 family)